MEVPNLVVRWQSKRYFSGLEHRHTGETLDETHVSMAMRGDYLSDRYPRIGNEDFETGEKKTDAILITVQWYPCRCIRVFLDGSMRRHDLD